MSSFSQFFFGSPGGVEQVDRFTPQQRQQLESQLGGIQQPTQQGLDYISQLLSGDESAFNQFEAPLKRQFQQETIPGIAERFAGMGSHGAQSSSALNQTLSQAGRELTENLGALRGNLRQGALGQLQGLLGQSMQPSFENVYKQPTQGALGGLLTSLGGGLGTYAGLRALGGLNQGNSPMGTSGASLNI